jgi:hypothetical protein
MARVTVPVLKPLTYQGRSYVRGESVSMEAIEAAAHGRAGRVNLTLGAAAPSGAYQTADMVVDVAGEPKARRRRRRYRRRDMTAESSPE